MVGVVGSAGSTGGSIAADVAMGDAGSAGTGVGEGVCAEKASVDDTRRTAIAINWITVIAPLRRHSLPVSALRITGIGGVDVVAVIAGEAASEGSIVAGRTLGNDCAIDHAGICGVIVCIVCSTGSTGNSVVADIAKGNTMLADASSWEGIRAVIVSLDYAGV
jgi:hypothetical protein